MTTIYQTAMHRMKTARTRLIMEFPFLGVLAMKLPLKMASPDWCPTVATDAKALYFNVAWIISLKEYEIRFAIAHEAMHCALGHFVRRKTRDRFRWNIACDFSVNGILSDAGMARPVEALYDRRMSKLSADEIYSLIEAGFRGSTLDCHIDAQEAAQYRLLMEQSKMQVDEELAGYPTPIGHQELEKLARHWRQRLASAAQHALRTSHASEHMRRLINRLLRPKISWRELLVPYFMSLAFNDYSYDRISRREGDAILPRLRSRGSKVHVVLDTSGSIKAQELSAFVAEVNSMKSMAGLDITLHTCDMTLSKEGPWHFPSWRAMVIPEYLSGGGGTDFRPIFEWLSQRNERPDLLIYFTDGMGPFPKTPADFPVLWVIKGYCNIPWGTRITLN